MCQRTTGVCQNHCLDALHGRDGTLVLQRDEGVAPFGRQQVVHAAEVLAELDEDGPVALEGAEGAFCAAQVACFELLFVVGVGLALECRAVAVLSVAERSEGCEEHSKQPMWPPHVWVSYSLMLSASVAATLYVLCAALQACFASSFSVTTAAPSAMPPPRTSSLRLLLLFLNAGRAAVVVSTLLANVWRCCRRVWRCDCRHVRHVHGVALRRASEEPRRRTGDSMEADITDIIRSWYLGMRNLRRCTARQKETNEGVEWSCRRRSIRHFPQVQPLSQIGLMPTVRGVFALHMLRHDTWIIEHTVTCLMLVSQILTVMST